MSDTKSTQSDTPQPDKKPAATEPKRAEKETAETKKPAESAAGKIKSSDAPKAAPESAKDAAPAQSVSPAQAAAPAPAKKEGSGGKGCLWVFLVLLLMSGLAAGALLLGRAQIFEYIGWKWNKFASENFVTDIEESFKEETLRIASTKGNVLELATKDTQETFTRKTRVKVFGHAVPFTENEVALKTNATYRYHIKLDGNWDLAVHDSSIVVVCPSVEATLPVAFDSKKMEETIKGYWLSILQQGESMEELKRSLTEKLGSRAESSESIDSVREACRESVAGFVKNWLISKHQWQEDRFTEIKVVLPDEKVDDFSEMPATLVLNQSGEIQQILE